MTNKEAIEYFKMRLYNANTNVSKTGKQRKAFIRALDALEKQIPKKPTIMEDISTVEQGYDCPSCHSIIFEADGDYCPWCGQAIDWSDEE